MLQRHRRPRLQEYINVTREQLQEDFSHLFNPRFLKNQIKQTADTLLTMLSNVSSPLIGTQIIKEKLLINKHPHGLQIQSILDKAEIFYLESVTYDLKKLHEEQRITQIELEDLKEYIQQINQKLGFDRESMLNESQDIGENFDVMKFFQGVRSYQDQFQSNQKHSIEKLKNIAVRTEKELTLKKGFLSGKLATIQQQFMSDTFGSAFGKLKGNYQISKKIDKICHIYNKKLSQAFSTLYLISKSKSPRQILRQKLSELGNKAFKKQLWRGFRDLHNFNNRALLAAEIIMAIWKQKRTIQFNRFYKKINVKPYEKVSNYVLAAQKIKNIFKKKNMLRLYAATNLTVKPITHLLGKIYITRLSKLMGNIKQFALGNTPKQKVVSEKVKGKILLSLDHHQKKPMNLKKTFLSWYLNTHETEYSKKIYNIWLKANVSKFVFFMRMKDCVNESKKHIIKHELKVFLLIFMQNMNKYYDYNQKYFLSQWRLNITRSKKLQHLCFKISDASELIDQSLMKHGMKAILSKYEIKQRLAKYLNYMTQSKIGKVKFSFDKWKTIPNIKKLKGRVLLIKYLGNKLKLMKQGQRNTFNTFKQHYTYGKSQKIRLLTKIFARDIVYLGNYFNRWRHNSNKDQYAEKTAKSQMLNGKQLALTKLICQVNKNNHLKALQVINMFQTKRKFNQNRKFFTKNILKKLISKYTNKGIEEVFSCFISATNEGVNKKEKLVRDLVTANKFKQLQVLSIMGRFASVEREHEKKQRIKKSFLVISENIKSNITDDFFVLNPVYRTIQKIATNHLKNMTQSLLTLQELPPRMKRQKRAKCIQFYNKLEFLINVKASSTFNSFKSCHFSGQFKKKRMLDIMTFRYVDSSKNYFKIYYRNVRQLKLKEQSRALSEVFDQLNTVSHNNMEILMEDEKSWRKKEEYLKKLGMKVKEKIKYAFKMWHSNSKSLGYFSKIQNQKKKRVLNFISESLSKNQFATTKRCVHMFHKNSKIIQLQTNFLRRLCDTQAGKVSKALMIWKNLPEQQNKQLITKVSKFQSNLKRHAEKILRSIFHAFRNTHYFGNQKKKYCIRKLVQKSCSGIEKYFQIWRKNNDLITLFQKTSRVESMNKVMLGIQRNNFLMLFQGNISVKVSNSFENLIQFWENKKKLYFERWVHKTKEIKAYEQEKRKRLLSLSEIEKRNHKKTVIGIIHQIKTRAMIKKIFFGYFVQSKKNMGIEGIKMMKALPDWKKKLQKQKKMSKVSNIMTMLGQERRKDLNSVFDIFRDNRYNGNFKKCKSMDTYLKDKIREVHNILRDWNYMAQTKKQQQKFQKVSMMFGSTYEICRSNFSQIISNVRQIQIKKKAIDKLLKTQQIRMQGYLKKWSTNVKELKIQEEFSNQKKKMILQKINSLLANSSGQNTKKAIKKFYLNFKITNVQTKFLQRLLMTKSGKTMHAFNKWKSIPSQNLMEKYKKGQKFFFKLEHLLKNKISEVQNSFKDQLESGKSIKKQSVIKLLDLTSTGIRRYYNRWDKITKRDTTLHQATSIMHALMTLNQQVAENFSIIFQDQRTSKIKTWAIERIIQSCGQNKGQYFRKWKQINRQIKMNEMMSMKEKTTALEAFSKVLGKSQNQGTRLVIQKFNKNMHITKISINFLNRLLRTKSGKAMQLFQLWKSIPNQKVALKKKKAIKFQSNLNKMVHKFMKKGFEPFKIESNMARNKKIFCIQRLVKASMGEEKKRFLLWRQIVKQQKILSHSDIFNKIFQNMIATTANNWAILTKDSSSQTAKKRNLCRRLISNASFVQHHAYFIWKQALQTDNIKIEKQQGNARLHLINLVQIEEKSTNKKLLQVIKKFRQLRGAKEEHKSNKQKEQKNRKVLSLMHKLSDVTNQRCKWFLEILRKDNEESKFLNKSSEVDRVFSMMNNVFGEGLYIVFRSNRETLIIEKALNKIFANFSGSTQRAFNIWRENKNIIKLQQSMDQEKKKNILGIINKVLQNKEKKQIPYAISKFQKNYVQLKLQREILQKILQTKAGKVPLAFMLWKSIPNQSAKKIKQKALKFQMGLSRLYSGKLKYIYEKFKENQYQGNSKKKIAVNKLVLATMSDSNRYINKWRKASHESKITDRLTIIQRGFELMENTFRVNFPLFDQSYISEYERKCQVIISLGRNIMRKNQQAFSLWRYNICEHKCHKFMNITTKYQPNYFRTKALLTGFGTIKKKSDIQAVRAYINSLWKWKMSNFEANYYSKFIKVFKESEELLSLSSCLNKKTNDHLHSGFRAILMAGVDKHNRKVHITQKYLTRKIQNYFNRFKLNAYFSEIQLWKNNYKESIKAKKLLDVIEKAVRRRQTQVIEELKHHQVSLENIKEGIHKMIEYEDNLKKYVIVMINNAGYERFYYRFEQIIETITRRKNQECFDSIRKYSEVSTLIESTVKLMKVYNERSGLNMIKKKSNLKHRYMLGIRLLETIQSQRLKLGKQKVVLSFKSLATRIHVVRNIFNMIASKEAENQKQFYMIIQKVKNRETLLNKFRKGMLIKKILDRQDKKLIKKMFERMRAEQNKWLQASFKRFILRSSIKSSMAVSLSRLKQFANQQIS